MSGSAPPALLLSQVEARRDWRRRWIEGIAVALLALTLNLTGNARTSLWDRDEPRYAECTREMIARGDWLLPTFNQEPRFHKPILIYWLMRGGFLIGGDNPFGARLVSGLAGAGTCLLVLAMGRRMLGPRAGLMAALMLATSPIMIIESKLATTDATLALLLVGCQFCLWELSRTASRKLAALFWALLALATLTKGPVGLALIAVAGGLSWWWGGSAAAWGRLQWRWGIALFLAIAAPWFVAVGVLSEGEFFRFALGKQVAERVVSGLEQHYGFPGYYVLTSVATFYPWSALLPAAIVGAWARRRADPNFGFLLGWVVGPLILLECVRTKLVHYYLPSYPACALLAAWLVDSLLIEEVNLRRWPLGRLGHGLLAGVGVGLTVGFLAGGVVLPSALRWPCLATALVVGSGTLWSLIKLQRAANKQAVAGLVGTWAIAMLVISGWLIPSAEPYRTSRLVGERLGRLSSEFSAAPLLLSFQEPSIVYAMGRSAAMVRTWDGFYRELDHHGAIVTALMPKEILEFEERRDHLEVDYRETIEGFNLNKGKTEMLRIAVIRRKPKPERRSDEAIVRASGEKLLVK